jgi:hypothetical protein
MQNKEIFFPVCGQILLTFVVQCSLINSRIRAVKHARVNPQAIADSTRFDEVMKGLENISENFENLFEMPVLFFIASVLIFVFQATDSFYLIAGWSFVFFRALHSFIHCTYNRITHRTYAYLLSSIILWVMWARIGYQLVTKL